MLGAGVAGDRRWKMRGEPGVLDHVLAFYAIGLRYRPMSRSRRTPRLYNKDGHGQACRKRRGDTMTDGNPGADWSDEIRVFDEHRDLLFAVAYRVLGSVTDADDVVQEAWLRWVNARPSEVRPQGLPRAREYPACGRPAASGEGPPRVLRRPLAAGARAYRPRCCGRRRPCRVGLGGDAHSARDPDSAGEGSVRTAGGVRDAPRRDRRDPRPQGGGGTPARS